MRADLQEQIAPTMSFGATQDFSDQKITTAEKALDSTVDNRTSFKDLILASEDEVRKEREAKKNNDLSSAKNDADFLQKLQDMSKPKQEIKNTLDKDDFLKLFVAQLQHQDPLNPDDGAEMASKLAQFNSLEQMMNVNKTLEKMSDSQNSEKSSRLVNYINREVTTTGGQVRLGQGKLVSDSSYELSKDATSATLQIRDGAGSVVFEKPLGSLKAGTHRLNWDGKSVDGQPLGDGTYSYSLTAKDIDGMDIPINLTSRSMITGIDLKDKEGGFFTENGRVKYTDIISIGNPGFKQEAERNARLAAKPSSVASTAEGLEKLKIDNQMNLDEQSKEKEGKNSEPVNAMAPEKVEAAAIKPVAAKEDEKKVSETPEHHPAN